MAAKVIRLDLVWEMLVKCAPEHKVRVTDHYYVVTYNKKTFNTLPLGKHGARKTPEIEAGYVRSMARHLEIAACAKRELPNIF